MNHRSLSPLVLLLAALTGGAWLAIVRQPGGDAGAILKAPPAPAAGTADHAPVAQVGTSSPAEAAAGAPAAVVQPSTAAAAFPINDGFVPGHFPGVSVREEPGIHRPTPPSGTPRTQPPEQEIVLPDGRRLIGVTLDETWRIPLRAKTPP